MRTEERYVVVYMYSNTRRRKRSVTIRDFPLEPISISIPWPLFPVLHSVDAPRTRGCFDTQEISRNTLCWIRKNKTRARAERKRNDRPK